MEGLVYSPLCNEVEKACTSMGDQEKGTQNEESAGNVRKLATRQANELVGDNIVLKSYENINSVTDYNMRQVDSPMHNNGVQMANILEVQVPSNDEVKLATRQDSVTDYEMRHVDSPMHDNGVQMANIPEVQVPSYDEVKSSYKPEYVNNMGKYNMRQVDSPICNNRERMSIYPGVDVPVNDKLLPDLGNQGNGALSPGEASIKGLATRQFQIKKPHDPEDIPKGDSTQTKEYSKVAMGEDKGGSVGETGVLFVEPQGTPNTPIVKTGETSVSAEGALKLGMPNDSEIPGEDRFPVGVNIPRVGSLHAPRGVTARIPVTVNGVTLVATIDSGAEITVLRRDMLGPCNLNVNELQKSHLQGPFGQIQDNCYITPDVNFQCGGVRSLRPILISDITDQMLLGSDFMYQHHCVIDYGQRVFHCGGESTPLNISLTADGYGLSEVTLCQTVRLPPHAAVPALVFVGRPEGLMHIEQAVDLPEETGLIEAMITAGPGASVCLTNTGDRWMTMTKNTIVGWASPVDRYWDVDEILGSISTKVNNEYTPPKIRSTQGTPCSDSIPSIPTHLESLYLDGCALLDPEEKMQLAHLLSEYQDVFSKGEFDLGNCTKINHHIDTGQAKPIRQRMRRTPLGFEQEEENNLKAMLQHGIIQPSQFNWASAPVLIRKRDGNVRYCIDYRALNACTIKDAFPLPRIEECLDMLNGVRHYCTLDLASGYWQLNLNAADRHKTAFITKYGLYEHIKMGFGLCNAPATFQRAMNFMLTGLLWTKVLAYLDDVILLGRDIPDTLKTLEEVFKRLRSFNLKLKPGKCKMFQEKVEFLGRLVGPDGMRITTDKMESIHTWGVPKNRKELEAYLGFMNYHREFIPGFAGLAECLYSLTRNKCKFAWNEDHQRAFLMLKKVASENIVLAYPNALDPFILDTDASDFAVGAALIQVQNEHETPIAFASKTLTPTQRNYCTTRRELLAVVVFT